MPDDPDLRGVYERIIDGVSADDAGVLEGLVAADLIDHNPVPGQPSGREGFISWMHGMHAAFPDMTGAIEDTVVEGGRIAGRVLWTGTHQGEFLGLPGTGRRISITAMHLVRFEGGMAAEWWGAADLLGAAMSLDARLEPPR
ncbi:ester cyclase [Arthrobacter sp. Br18]|uniref:ester cyclase n=1 Tax=Arthrobacter sp. Br18 TaxID=1312954 RepID=UPI0004B48490|nr:ester cyclase [Arthrobacter sp. Br18]